MKHESRSSLWWTRSLVLVLAGLLATVAAAQQPPSKSAAEPGKSGAGTASQTAKEVAKPRGRLPAYFGQVVSLKQRQEIYAIQARYHEQITKLEEQLDALTVKRNQEVEQVLSEEQRAEIARLKASRRSRGRAAGASSDSGESGSK